MEIKPLIIPGVGAALVPSLITLFDFLVPWPSSGVGPSLLAVIVGSIIGIIVAGLRRERRAGSGKMTKKEGVVLVGALVIAASTCLLAVTLYGTFVVELSWRAGGELQSQKVLVGFEFLPQQEARYGSVPPAEAVAANGGEASLIWTPASIATIGVMLLLLQFSFGLALEYAVTTASYHGFTGRSQR